MKYFSASLAVLPLFGGSALGADTSDPVVSDFTYTTAVEVGSMFSASITVSDNVGVDRVIFSAYPTSGGWWYPCEESKFTLVNGTAAAGTWALECAISQDTPSQSYGVSYTAYDAAGNSAFKTYRKGFVVTEGPALDKNPPVIAKVDYASKVPAASTFTASLSITDESGVDTGYMVVRESVGSYTACTAQDIVLVSGTSLDGVWTASCFIESAAPDGEYYLEIHVNDVQKNPADLYIQNAFSLYGGSDKDLTSPVIASIKFSDSAVDWGQTMTITAQVSDSDTGVKYVSFYANEQYSGVSFCKEDMLLVSGDETVGSYELLCEIPSGIDYTVYTANVLAYDGQNNVGYKTASFKVEPSSGN